MYMKKPPLNKQLKAERKSDETVLIGAQEAGTVKEVCKNESIKKQFAQNALIYERIKCPIAAIACSFIHQI
jgi:hypothetical protein